MAMNNLGKAMTLRGKLIASLLGMAVLFLAAAVFNLGQVRQIKTELERQNHKVELKLMALELKEMVQELNIIASGLEISKKADFIPIYNEKRKLFEAMVTRIGETADTEEKIDWRSKLILLTGEYTSTFDVAARLIRERQLSDSDLDKNMEYLYNESQKLMEQIFTYVDRFYVSYAGDAEAAVAVTRSRLDSTVRMMIGAFIAVALCVIAIGYSLTQSFMRPIHKLRLAVARIAEGDLIYKIGNESMDELGRLSQSFDHMVDQICGMLRRTQSIANSLSDHAQSFREFSAATAAANQDIVRAIREIAAGAEQQSLRSEQSNALISNAAQELQQISSHADEMLRKSMQAAAHTRSGSQTMDALRSASADSEAVLEQVSLAMDALSEGSAQIGHIVGTISEISAQTNVLALNASIEAARAGKSGLGFSVISDEIRRLSVQTNESAGRINRIVDSLREQMGQLEASVDTVKRSFAEQGVKMTESLGAFDEIRSSADELSERIGQVHRLIAHTEQSCGALVSSAAQVAAISQETAAGVEEIHSSSTLQNTAKQQIAAQTDDMLELASRLFAEIGRFQIDQEGGMDRLASGTSTNTMPGSRQPSDAIPLS